MNSKFAFPLLLVEKFRGLIVQLFIPDHNTQILLTLAHRDNRLRFPEGLISVHVLLLLHSVSVQVLRRKLELISAGQKRRGQLVVFSHI